MLLFLEPLRTEQPYELCTCSILTVSQCDTVPSQLLMSPHCCSFMEFQFDSVQESGKFFCRPNLPTEMKTHGGVINNTAAQTDRVTARESAELKSHKFTHLFYKKI